MIPPVARTTRRARTSNTPPPAAHAELVELRGKGGDKASGGGTARVRQPLCCLPEVAREVVFARLQHLRRFGRVRERGQPRLGVVEVREDVGVEVCRPRAAHPHRPRPLLARIPFRSARAFRDACGTVCHGEARCERLVACECLANHPAYVFVRNGSESHHRQHVGSVTVGIATGHRRLTAASLPT